MNLTPALERFIRTRVRKGLFGNASEVVREALRLLVQQDRQREANHEPHRAGVPDGRAQSGGRGAAHGFAVAPPDEKRPGPPRETERACVPPWHGTAHSLRFALDLLELAHALMEQNLRREGPDGSDTTLSQRLAAWRDDADWGEETPGHLERSPERLERLLREQD